MSPRQLARQFESYGTSDFQYQRSPSTSVERDSAATTTHATVATAASSTSHESADLALPRPPPEAVTPSMADPSVPWSVKVAWATQSVVAGALPAAVVAAVAQRVGLLDHQGNMVLTPQAAAAGHAAAGAITGAGVGGSGGFESVFSRRSRSMYAPGRLVHLIEPDEGHKHQGAAPKTSVEAAWVPRTALAAGGEQSLSTRLLFPAAVTDHFPWHILKALDEAIAAARAREDSCR